MRIAVHWDVITAKLPDPQLRSLQRIQRLLAAPKAVPEESETQLGDSGSSPIREVHEAVNTYFSTSAHGVESSNAPLNANLQFSANNQQANSSAPRHRVFLSPDDDDRTIAQEIECVIAQIADHTLEQALMLLPARCEADWLSMLDHCPRVFLRSVNGERDVVRTRALLLVGLIPDEQILEFHRAFHRLGPVFVPFSFAFREEDSA
jgi:hypothetical protein